MLNHLVVTLSKPSLLILLLFLLTTLQPHPVSAQPPTKPTYFIDFCRAKFGNYSANSTYEKHLKSVLSDLKSNSSVHSSYNTTATGGRKSKVYGQYYCRGDIDQNLCHDCVDQAADAIQRNCSRSRAAIMWFEECTLQYGNRSMAGLEAEYPRSWWFSSTNVSDTGKFGDILNNTVDRIINKSAYGNGSLHFATGEGVVSPTETVYSLVQCIPGLNGTQCETCLKSAYDVVPNCCGSWLKWAFVFFPSCQFRYSAERPFYAIPNGMQGPSLAPSVQPPLSLLPPTPSVQPFPPSLPPTPSVQPPSVQTSPPLLSPTEVVTGNSKAGSSCRESMKLGLLVAAVALLMFRPTT